MPALRSGHHALERRQGLESVVPAAAVASCAAGPTLLWPVHRVRPHQRGLCRARRRRPHAALASEQGAAGQSAGVPRGERHELDKLLSEHVRMSRDIAEDDAGGPEAQRQRQIAGMYNNARLPEQRRQKVLFQGGHPIFAEACQRKGLPYPEIDEEGQIVANEEWWQKMQMSKDAWQRLDE